MSAWSRLRAVGEPFFVSSQRWRVGGALAVIVTLLVLLNALNVANSYVGRNFMTAIAEHDRGRFVRYSAAYLVVFAASTSAAVTAQFVQDRLALCWREWLTRHLLTRYLEHGALESVRANSDIDNPDQRIAEDVRTFTSILLSFGVMVANAAMTTVSFAGVLWSIMPLLLLAAVLYAVMGSLATIKIGYPLVSLDQTQLRREADLRHGIIRLRERVEPRSVPQDEADARRVMGRVRRVVGNSRSVIAVSRNLGLFTTGYNYMVPLLPVLVVAPRYLRGDIEFGVVTQSAMAFAQLLGAFSLVVVQFQSIAAFTAVIHRVGSLWEAMGVRSPCGHPS